MELAWPEERIALALDLAPSEIATLRAQTWTVIDARTSEPGWARAALASLASAHGAIDVDRDTDDAASQ